MGFREKVIDGDFHLHSGHRTLLFYEDCYNRSELFDFLADAGCTVKELRFDKYVDKGDLQKKLFDRAKGAAIVIAVISSANCDRILEHIEVLALKKPFLPIVVASLDDQCIAYAKRMFADTVMFFVSNTNASILGDTAVKLLNMESTDVAFS